MKADNVRHDIISAVFNHAKSYNLYKIAEKAKALQQFLTTDTGNELLSAYIRASNIVTIEEKKDKVTYDGSKTIALDVDLTEEDKQLSATLANIAPNIENYIKNDNYLAALKDLEYLRVPINNFFNNVLVNTENRALRDYRLNTLAKVRKILNVIADFSLIEG
jgi:glycyl-tRNA synthetase beta chain